MKPKRKKSSKQPSPEFETIFAENYGKFLLSPLGAKLRRWENHKVRLNKVGQIFCLRFGIPMEEDNCWDKKVFEETGYLDLSDHCRMVLLETLDRGGFVTENDLSLQLIQDEAKRLLAQWEAGKADGTAFAANNALPADATGEIWRDHLISIESAKLFGVETEFQRRGEPWFDGFLTAVEKARGMKS
jgi:hypothetical protein